MTFKTIFSIVSVVIFLLFGWWIIFYPSIYSKRMSLNGEVSIVWKTNPPRAHWIIEVQEGEKVREVTDLFINEVVTIQKGDSLRKEKGSEDFYLKKKNTNYWILFENRGRVRD
jgi:hypothetical protein